jgi:predicted  nucleic acid-binding Zn-ribbon protein
MDIKELRKKIEEQKEQNIKLYEIFQYKEYKEEMQPVIEQWREGSKKLKELLNKLYELERKEKASLKAINKETQTLINGFGEATEREITSSTYERADKRMQKEIMCFMGNR